MVEDELVTEAGGDPRAGYERRTTAELVELMNAHDTSVPSAVARASTELAETIDAIVERMRAGGRLVYVGAGSSGLIAALDASECEATFGTPPGQVTALVAGGRESAPLDQAAAEDDGAAGARDVEALGLDARDAVVGVSASGATAYVVGALEAAAAAGALTACVVGARGSRLADVADHEIAVVTGPELIAGSTRLKAGTAQKLVLNAISTISMIRLGKTYGSLMVDVVAANEKLAARVRRIVGAATDATGAEIDDALAAADGDARVAIVSLLAGVDAEAARARLEASGRSIADALGGSP
jgi:N-acetylmuramic acid 6-phosphate etherase